MNRSVSTCSKCPAQIIWTLSEAGAKMPLDAEPDPFGGSFVIFESPDDGTLRSVFHKKACAHDLPDDLPRHKSHHATCPKASHFRKKQF